MNVGLAIESDVSVEHLMPAVLGINNALEGYFANRSYGSDVTNAAIGTILVTGAISERFHPVRPFRYTRFKREKSRITGEIFEVHTTVGWDVKPNFATFSGQSLDGVRDCLCEALIASTAILEEHHDQYPDFDVTRFRTDFSACLRAHCGTLDGARATGAPSD
jgi:hypothetical protein